MVRLFAPRGVRISATLVMILAAGCLGSGAAPAQNYRAGQEPLVGPSVEIVPGKASLFVQVVNEELLPVSPAEVTLVRFGFPTRSMPVDEQGVATFSGLEPGEWTVRSEANLYLGAERVVMLEPEVVLSLTLILERVAGTEPFLTVAERASVLECALPVNVTGTGTTDFCWFAAYTLAGNAGVVLFQESYLPWLVEGPYEGWQAMLVEMSWAAQSASARRLGVHTMVMCSTARASFGTSFGTSPVQVLSDRARIEATLEQASAQPYPGDRHCRATGGEPDPRQPGRNVELCREQGECHLVSQIAAQAGTVGNGGQGDFAVFFNQRVKLYLTAAYYQLLPADYTALADA